MVHRYVLLLLFSERLEISNHITTEAKKYTYAHICNPYNLITFLLYVGKILHNKISYRFQVTIMVFNR
jgi:hypothetical protein